MPAPFSDPIVAQITPAGVGGVSLLRLSGEGVRVIVARNVRGIDVVGAAPQSVHRGIFVDNASRRVDEVLVTFFNSPHSYTGEDVVEIGCHGNPIIVASILDVLVESGARLAEPGEFTKRAFMNGRIDLSQAEAVADIISANSASGLDIANKQLHGELGSRILAIIDDLVKICGIIELELDFVEEGISFESPDAIHNRIESVRDLLDRIRTTFNRGRLQAHGIKVAIVGKPNVGKSSILNRIAGEERAIVSPIPGTTRDTINFAVQHKGVLLEFWDTAGMRSTSNSIEQMGIVRAQEMVEKSNVLVYVVDGGQPFELSDLEGLGNFNSLSRKIIAVNKCDLELSPSVRDIFANYSNAVLVSAKLGTGIADVLNLVVSVALPADSIVGEDVTLTSQRHYDCIVRAMNSLSDSLKDFDGKSGEFVSADLRLAVACLGEITGIVTSDEILSSIFSNFCIGK